MDGRREKLCYSDLDILYDVDDSSKFVSNKGQMPIFVLELPFKIHNQLIKRIFLK
jgi:hypothetical protein